MYPNTTLPAAQDSDFGGQPANVFGVPAFQWINSVLQYLEGAFLTYDRVPYTTEVFLSSNSAIAGDVAAIDLGATAGGGAYTVARYSGSMVNPSIIGVYLEAVSGGNQARIAISGVLPPTITGLGAVSGIAGLNTSTGRVRIAQGGDITVGSIDPQGNLILGLAVGSSTSQGSVSTFGNGGDGDVTFDGTSTVLGLVPSSGLYNMTRDIHARNLSVTNSAILITNGFRIFAQLACTIAASAAITNTVGGHTGGPAGTLAGGGNAGVGGTGAGAAGTSTANTYGGSGAAGGSGTSGAGGAGGGSTSPVNQSISGTFAFMGATWSAAGGLVGIAGGGGGGAGAGDGSNNGANGGGGGGVVLICARYFNNLGTVSANGANGANASTGNTGGGGGGGGGEIIIGYGSLMSQGTISLSGGTGGTGHGTGTNGSNGGAGTAVIIPV